MQRIARFLTVSQNQFAADLHKCAPEVCADTAYAAVRIPKRATAGSAGYDFIIPFDCTLAPGETLRIPTGLRAEMADGWVLCLFPRSGLGCKFRTQLDNTVGVIDSDYFYADNEGHIQVQITNDSRQNKTLALHAGDAFAQGVFFPYGITQDDDAVASRKGGFGSTDRK